MTRDIVVVDDEPQKSLPLVSFLQGEGYRVRFACSGLEALDIIEERRPDCVICDLEMPDMSGYAVLETLVIRLGMRNMPFFLTNEEWTVENWSKQVGGRSADCHFNKPFVLAEVGAILRRFLGSIMEE